MVDIIIPVYKSKDKLYATLFSIGFNYKDIEVILVDDCSGDTYEDVVEQFKPFFPIKVIYCKENGGPGIARNIGIDNATGEYIIFIDCGDVFMNPFTIKQMVQATVENPWAKMISFAHLEEKDDGVLEYTSSINNRIHGKIFKRNLLNMYQLRFNTICPRINEDIGFCQTLRFLNREAEKNQTPFILNVEDNPTVIWCCHMDSLVRKNNFQYFYTRQNIGLAYNSLFAIENARKWGVSEEFIIPIICEHMAFMYVMFMCTHNDRPEFDEIAWAGAQHYYNNIYEEYSKIDPGQITFSTQRVIGEAYADETNPFNYKIISYTYPQFLQDLEQRRVSGDTSHEQILLDHITSN